MMFNSFHRKIITSTSPTPNKHSLTYDHKLDIQEQIQNLEEEFNTFELQQSANISQLQKIFEKLDHSLATSKQITSFKLDQHIDNLDKQLTITSNVQRDAILQSRKRLKSYVQSKKALIEEILDLQIKEQQVFQTQISTVVHKRLGEIRKKLTRTNPIQQKSRFAKKKEGHPLRQKLSEKIRNLESIITENKDETKKMKRESQKLIREYLRVKDDIEKSRLDRENKEQQILAKIQQLCVGDRTKEETISKIE